MNYGLAPLANYSFIGTGFWVVVSGQWRAFMLQFGFSPLAEMMMLAALLVGTMWWMAVRYSAGLKD